MLRIALVDDHPVFRTGLRALLECERDLEVVAECDDAQGGRLLAQKEVANLFIVDVVLQDGDGIALVPSLVASGGRVLMLTMKNDAEHAARALAAGASGYALKSEPAAVTLEAIRRVAEGGQYIPDSLKTVLPVEPGAPQLQGLAALSAREREVFELVVEGRTGRQIAQALFISPKTVESHRYQINRKLGVHSIAQLMRLAAMNGLLRD